MGDSVVLAQESKQRRRSFSGIRHDILSTLNDGRITVNEISRRTSINWKTVDNHLIYLCGRGWAEKVFDSPHVKIFDITEDGKEQIAKSVRRSAMALAKQAREKQFSKTVMIST